MWKQINDYPNYEINEEGIIRRFGEIRKSSLNTSKYYQIRLQKDEKCKFYLIHRLIALQFIPNPDNLPYVDHINGIRTDNRVENLRWVSGIQNNWNNCGKGYFLRGNKYQAHIRQNGRTIHLGLHDTPEEARQAYETKFLELRSEEFLRK